MAVSLLRLWVSSVRPSTRRFASAQDEVALEFFSAIKKPPHALGVTRQKMSMPLEKSTHPEQAPNGRAVEGRDNGLPRASRPPHHLLGFAVVMRAANRYRVLR